MTWKYFKKEEFACSCGECENGINEDFITLLDLLRERAGIPFVITSGYRCPEYNARVSSTGKDGPHTTGLAADIAARNSKDRYKILSVILEAEANRVGIHKNFIHVDYSSFHPPEVVWLY